MIKQVIKKKSKTINNEARGLLQQATSKLFSGRVSTNPNFITNILMGLI